ncbi:putative protein-like isoform X2 [Capsicum annuum]|nr:putative protein-like isoform X2 [Capsicum annuum]
MAKTKRKLQYKDGKWHEGSILGRYRWLEQGTLKDLFSDIYILNQQQNATVVEAVLTKENLMKRGFNPNPTCFLSEEVDETVTHLFLHLEIGVLVYSMIYFPVQLKTPLQHGGVERRMPMIITYLVYTIGRLRLIEIFDVKRLEMRYATSIIGGSSNLATFVAVYSLFGPTYPGTYDKDRGVYTLFYPGLSFAFPIPSQYADCCRDGEAELPLEFPDGTTPVTCRVSIYDSSSGSKVGVGSMMNKACTPPLPAGSHYMEEVHVKLGEELRFSIGGQHILFGASPQDVWTELGRPCGVHQKQVDQMVIHSASDPRPKTTLCGDYFYNYFPRGLDILFDGQTHKIKKFILHTNYPGHADFNTYMKCNFVIYCSDSVGSYDQDVNSSKATITASTKWEQVKEILGDCGQAAIQTQGSTSNPFGSTFVYGYPNVAFEVMKNGYIATVTLFQS